MYDYKLPDGRHTDRGNINRSSARWTDGQKDEIHRRDQTILIQCLCLEKGSDQLIVMLFIYPSISVQNS